MTLLGQEGGSSWHDEDRRAYIQARWGLSSVIDGVGGRRGSAQLPSTLRAPPCLHLDSPPLRAHMTRRASASPRRTFDGEASHLLPHLGTTPHPPPVISKAPRTFLPETPYDGRHLTPIPIPKHLRPRPPFL